MSETTSSTRGPAVGPPRRRVRVRAVLVVATLVLGGLGLVGAERPTPVVAVGAAHPTQVRDVPTENTPHVTNGEVRSVAVAGDTVILGGTFTGSTDPDRTTVVNRSYLLAFDRITGRILRDWAPQVDREVYSVIAAPDGQSVYVGGRFNNIDGVTQHKVARLDVATGRPLPFTSGVDAVVNELALVDGRLYIGGVFNTVQGRARPLFAALNAQTGVVDDTVDLQFSGTHRGGEAKVWAIEPSPDGRQIVVVGNFARVLGQDRNQIARLDAPADGPVTLSPWRTTRYTGFCASFTDYVRDVSYSPDGSYFVVVTTGAKGSGLNGLCDAVARFENVPSATDAAPSWVQYSGGDSYYSVEATGAAIYVGGHFRWGNNSYGTDSLGAGGVPRPGIGALDPANGIPLTWNPGRDRGRAVWEMVATPDGLWVASDTDRIANGRYRGRIAFFPLAGGLPVPQPARPALPLDLHQYVAASGPTPARVLRRGFDGATVTSPEVVVANASSLAGVRAAFFADGILYTAHSDRTLRARSFDGTTLGAPIEIDLNRITAFATDLGNMTGAVYDNGRLYYTVSGSSTLYMRYFSVESRIVGAQRFDVAGSSGSFSYNQVGGMVLAGDRVHYVDRSSGRLMAATWNAGGGIDAASRTEISAANAHGVSWSNTVLWARPGVAPNQPPDAVIAVTCTGLRCEVDASASTDGDGAVTGVAWDFGDGQITVGATGTVTYAAPGTYEISATVTDNGGASAIATETVTVTDAAPEATFEVTCAAGACQVDATASSDPDGTIASYAWDFGDGATETGATAAHAYAESGAYRIELTVTDNRGVTASTARDVEVEVAGGPGGAASVVGVTAATPQASRTAHTVTVPAAVAAGDQLLLFAASNAPRGTALDAPEGWTRLADVDPSNARNAVFARTAAAGDAGATVTVTVGAAAKVDLVVAAYRGLAVPEGGVTAVTGTYAAPSVPVPAGGWVVSYWTDKSATTAAWEAPAGVTVRHAFAGTGAGHVSELLADSDGPAANPSGERTATVAAPTVQSAAVTVVLVPAAGGEGPGGEEPGGGDPGGEEPGEPAPGGVVAFAATTPQATSLVHHVTVPTDVEPGDQLLLFAASNAKRGTSLDAPAGWTRLADVDLANARNAVFARTAAAGDAGATVTVTLGERAKVDLVVAAYRGLAVPGGGLTSATGYTAPSAAVPAGGWVVSYWADKSATTSAWEAPAGVTVRHAFAGTGAGHVSELLADSDGPAANPSGERTASVAVPAGQAIALTVVLVPVD